MANLLFSEKFGLSIQESIDCVFVLNTLMKNWICTPGDRKMKAMAAVKMTV